MPGTRFSPLAVVSLVIPESAPPVIPPDEATSTVRKQSVPERSIRRRLLDVIDDEHIHRSRCRFQFEPELLLYRRED